MSKLHINKSVSRFLCLSLFLLNSTGVFSQSIERFAFVSGASYSSTTAPFVQSSIGELMVQSYFGISDVLTQGFVQTNQSIVTSSLNDNTCFTINVFPNPASERLHIDVSKKCKTEVQIEVMSVFGVKQTVILNSTKTEYKDEYDLFLEGLASGLYVINVYSSETGLTKVYKFLKL